MKNAYKCGKKYWVPQYWRCGDYGNAIEPATNPMHLLSNFVKKHG